ncbi:MAG: ABC transporter substrate-binding protein [Actinomycetota bacterium]|nr:ABC transporter substrate-binding protein [Actinomycetota bacterium]
MKRVTSFLTALILCALAGCAGGARSKLVIGVVAPASGANASIGREALRGAELAAADLNRRGGVAGTMISIVFRDDSDRATAPGQLRDLVRTPSLAAIIGPETSSLVSSDRDPTSVAHIPVLTLASDGSVAKDPGLFRIVPSNRAMAASLAGWLVTTRKLNKIAIASGAGAFGQDGTAAAKGALKRVGVQPSTVQQIEPGALDLSGLARGLRTSGADAVIEWCEPAEAARLTSAIRALGWDAQIVGPSNLFDTDYRALAGSATDGTVIAFPKISEETWFGQDLRDWFLAYHRRFTLLPIPHQQTLVSEIPMTALTAYDAVGLIADASLRAKSKDPARIRAALAATRDYRGILRSYSFGKDREAFGNSEVTPARLFNLAILYDVQPGFDLDRQIAFYKVQVSAFYVPDEYQQSEQGQKLKDRVLEQVLSDPENVQFFKAYEPPRPPPGPV